jgi:hypothetical protein
VNDRATSAISLYEPGEAVGDGDAAGDAVGKGDGEAVGDGDVGSPVVAGPGEGTRVVAGAVRSGGGGSYGPLSTADNAAATTTATSKHTGASTSTRGTRTNGRTHPSKTYHNNAANTTITATDSHHGNPRINRPLPSYTLPPSYPPARTARSDSEARGPVLWAKSHPLCSTAAMQTCEKIPSTHSGR